MGGSGSDEEWVRAVARAPTRCTTCQDKARGILQRLLATIRRLGVRVSRRRIYERVCERDPGFRDRVGIHAFFEHMKAGHEDAKRGP